MGKIPARCKFDEQHMTTFARIIAREVVAEMQRFSVTTDSEKIHIGPLTLDVQAYEARINGKRLDLTPQEFRLLAVLAEHAGTVLSRERLLALAWQNSANNPRTVDVYACRLRNKLHASLEKSDDLLEVEAVQKAGYKLEKTVSEKILADISK